jgi:glucarate dehydratase
MRITDVRATPVNIPFRAPYRFAYGSTAAVTKTIVEVETDEGVTGLGEAANGDCAAVVGRMRDRLVGLDPLDLNEAERRCAPRIRSLWEDVTSLRRTFGAIEMALWDLRGRAEGRPLHALLGGAVRRKVAFTEYFSYRLPGPAGDGGESSPLEVARYCARMVEEHGSPSFEGKVATVGLDEEIAMVREVRAAIGEERMLRLDANGGWTVPTALEAIRRLAPYGVRNLEEPVPSLEELARLRPHAALSFSAHVADLPRAVALGVPDAFVLDLVELGGIRRTVEFVEACELLGFGFWFYSGDAGIATAACLHVAAALEPLREPSQSLLRWQADDVVEQGPFTPERGLLSVPDGPGLGVTVDRAALARCHERYLADGPFPSGEVSRRTGAFTALRRF